MSRSSTRAIAKTEDIEVTFGAFERTGFRVPFMSSVLTVQQIKDYLALVTDDAKYATQDWSLEELYQREIDWFRVFQMTKEYLGSGSSRPAFFNSLTVVLTQDTQPPHGYTPPNASGSYQYNIPIGPIQINYERKDPQYKCPEACSFGSVSWNRHEVKAVAIDGQHRLAALKEWDGDDARKTSISVLFLIFDKKLGLRAPRGKTDVIPLMRSIFIDLNKHAKPVTRARNLLLDDKDPHAVQLRSLMSSTLSFFDSKPKRNNKWGLTIGSEGEFESKVPLCLIDWHGEGKSKIEKGPYCSSILAVDWFIQKVACASKTKGGKRLGNLDFFGLSVDDDDYYTKIEKELKLWPKSWKIIEPKFSKAKSNKSQFVFEIDAINAIESEFLSTWGRPFTRLLTQTNPYHSLAQLRISKNSITPQFGQWFQAKDQLESNRNKSKTVVSRYEEKLENIEVELRNAKVAVEDYYSVEAECNSLKENNVLFYLTGQRSLFISLGNLVDTHEAASWAKLTNKKISAYKSSINEFYADYLATALNSIDDTLKAKSLSIFSRTLTCHNGTGNLKGLSRSFWAGSICDRIDPKKIDFNETAAHRAARLIVLMAHIYWYKTVNNNRTTTLRNALLNRNNLDKFQFGSEVEKSIRTALGKLGDKNYNSPIGFHIAKLDPDEQKHYDALLKAYLEFIFDNC